MAGDNRALVARVLLCGAVVLAVVAVLCWTGQLPVDPRARGVLATALGVSAVADAVIGFVFLTKSGHAAGTEQVRVKAARRGAGGPADK
jgi:hypothetical protein